MMHASCGRHASAMALVLAIAMRGVGCRKTPPPPPDLPSGTRAVAVTVDEGGFRPSEVSVKKGEPTALVFTRTTDKSCGTAVVFPDLKIEKELPLDRPVAVVLPTGEARVLHFQCGMAMYHGKAVVE